MAENEPTRPVKAFRRHNIKMSVWANHYEQDGKTATRHSASPQKRYRDREGDWHDTNAYFPEDLLRLAELAREAAKWIEQTEDSPAAETEGTAF